jgi:DNA-binding NtrC family response regulator
MPEVRFAASGFPRVSNQTEAHAEKVRGRFVESPIQTPKSPYKFLNMGADRPGKTFLVIEDSSDDAILIRRAFDATVDCHAIVCRNLSEARAYLRGAGIYHDRKKFPFPNAVISDLHLGFESGVQFLKWVKSSSEFKDMPVIILTGTATSSECVGAKEAGALEILKKPARYEELKTMLIDLAAKLCG